MSQLCTLESRVDFGKHNSDMNNTKEKSDRGETDGLKLSTKTELEDTTQ